MLFFSLSFCISHSFWLCSSSQNHLVKLLALYYCALPFNFQPILQTQYTISYQVQIKVNNIPVCRSLCDFSAWVCLCYTYTLFSVYFFRWICAFFCTSFRCFNTNGTLFLSLTLSRIFVMNSSASRTWNTIHNRWMQNTNSFYTKLIVISDLNKSKHFFLASLLMLRHIFLLRCVTYRWDEMESKGNRRKKIGKTLWDLPGKLIKMIGLRLLLFGHSLFLLLICWVCAANKSSTQMEWESKPNK